MQHRDRDMTTDYHDCTVTIYTIIKNARLSVRDGSGRGRHMLSCCAAER